MTTSYRNKLTTPATLLEAVEASLKVSARHQAGAEEKPAAILWTDTDGQWQPIVSKLLERMPQLITLGQHDPTRRSGPAIWIKCVVARTLDIGLPKDSVPVVYLPSVSRQVLRAAADCPPLLQPLVELQYRGTVWTQRNGKDWTVEAFLVSEDGLGLDVARDDATKRSLQAALNALAETPMRQLEGKHLEAEDFDKLMVGDHPRDLLEWMNDPNGARSKWDAGKWHAFRSRCKKDYSFDPEAEGSLSAAERFGLRREPAWDQLWVRFSEAPGLYMGLPSLLERAKPSGELCFDAETWPDENDKAETRLRAALLELAEADDQSARKRILELEQEHGRRRRWVWAKLGKSSLAQALSHLSVLAHSTAIPPTGATLEEMARNYAGAGYEADAALLRALAEAKSNQDRVAIQSAARAVYLPWARTSAESFQQLVAMMPLPNKEQVSLIEASIGECLLFADGLRFDLGQLLRAACEERGLKVTLERRWAGTPTVTATAKPAVSPVALSLHGADVLPDTFAPSIKPANQELTTARFRKLMEEQGYQCIVVGETGDTSGKGWCECGQIDRRGHDLQLDLANHIADELSRLLERIIELLEAGWKQVRVVTDHGWLLMPGGLPKADLPGYLVESRWARCAAIKGQSKVSVPKVAWHWNPLAEAAVAPDISSFVAGLDYAHGGLSLQECLIPVLIIQPSAHTAVDSVRIKEVQWLGLRCRVTLESSTAGLNVDIRTKANLADSSLATAPKTCDAKGQASLIIPNEDSAGVAAIVVVTDRAGDVLAKQATTVGGS